MPIYQYTALTESGKQKKGMIDADSAREARRKLRSDRLYVTEIALLDEKGKARSVERSSTSTLTGEVKLPKLFERKINVRELAIVTRQLAVLLRSGLPLSEALNAMVEQATDSRTERIFRDLREKIASGSPLAEALARHPKTFSDLYVNMVRAGEASGNLDTVLFRLADYLGRQASLRGKVVSALTYPVILIFLGTSVVIFLMSYVVPKITAILLQRKQALPMPTEILINVSNFFKNFWWLMALGALGVFFAVKAFARTKHGRLMVDTYKLRIPVVGNILKKAAVARFTNTLSTLLKSGLPALDSLKIVSQVVNNALLSQVIDEIHQRILEGADIATPVKKSRVFPPAVGHMIAVGEESGELEEVLDRVTEAYEEEINLAIQRLTALMEPVILIILASVVLLIMLAVLLPLVQLQNL